MNAAMNDPMPDAHNRFGVQTRVEIVDQTPGGPLEGVRVDWPDLGGRWSVACGGELSAWQPDALDLAAEQSHGRIGRFKRGELDTGRAAVYREDHILHFTHHKAALRRRALRHGPGSRNGPAP